MAIKRSLDIHRLVSALDAQRRAEGLSWRQLAAESGVSPSLLSRMRNDQKPDADDLATLLSWLNTDAEIFFVSEAPEGQARTPELATQLAPLLRSRKDFSESEVAFLQNVIESSISLVKAQRGISAHETEA